MDKLLTDVWIGQSHIVCKSGAEQHKIDVDLRVVLAEIAGKIFGTLDEVATHPNLPLYEEHGIPMNGNVNGNKICLHADGIAYDGLVSSCRNRITGTLTAQFEDIIIEGYFEFSRQNPIANRASKTGIESNAEPMAFCV